MMLCKERAEGEQRSMWKVGIDMNFHKTMKTKKINESFFTRWPQEQGAAVLDAVVVAA